jgi:hypothetical protein
VEAQQTGQTVARGTVAVRLVAIGVALAAVTWIGVMTGGTVPTPLLAAEGTAPPTSTNGSLRPGTIRRIPFDEIPQLITVGEGAAYTILGVSEPYELVRVDAHTLVVSMRTLPGLHFALNAGGGALWVSSCKGDRFVACRENSLLRLDTDTLETVAELPMKDQIFDIELGSDALWVELAGSHDATILKLDPVTNQILSTFPVQGGMLAVGGGWVWIANLNANAVFQYDAATGREVARLGVPRNDPCWLAADQTTAWVTSCLFGKDRLSRIDAASNRVVDRMPFEGSATITVADGYLWMVTTSARDPYITVRRLDPATNKFVGQPIRIASDPAVGQHFSCSTLGGPSASWAGVGEGALWVTDCRDAELVRIQL